jgi:hypothetical protein
MIPLVSRGPCTHPHTGFKGAKKGDSSVDGWSVENGERVPVPLEEIMNLVDEPTWELEECALVGHSGHKIAKK